MPDPTNSPLQRNNCRVRSLIAILTATVALAIPTVTIAQPPAETPESVGCLAGYNDDTYQGDRPVSRYEFAAALNTCLLEIEQLLEAATADAATEAEFTTTERQLEGLQSQLEQLRQRLGTLEEDAGE